MNIGIVCYASVGGSGIIATELGKTLAARGHQRPRPQQRDAGRGSATTSPACPSTASRRPSYPLFREPQYLLSLANKIVQVSRDERLDIVHAHYAIPHATAAYLAQQILASTPRRVRAARHHDAARHRHHAARQRSARTRRSWRSASSSRTASPPSPRASRRDTYPRARRDLATSGSSRTSSTVRSTSGATWPALRARAGAERREDPDSRVELPAGQARDGGRRDLRARRARDAGAAADGRRRSGPGGRGAAGARARRRRRRGVPRRAGSGGAAAVGRPTSFCCRPSQESFGLAALEAMACEVPVVASRIGGLPEVVEDGVTGFLHAPDDLDGMAASVSRLLSRLGPPQTNGRGGAHRRRSAASATIASCPCTSCSTRKRWPPSDGAAAPRSRATLSPRLIAPAGEGGDWARTPCTTFSRPTIGGCHKKPCLSTRRRSWAKGSCR